MDQLSPYPERTGQPVQPGPVGHRHHPLRNPQHRFPLLPLRGSVARRASADEGWRRGLQPGCMTKWRLRAPFCVLPDWKQQCAMISSRHENS
nr:hypothetical protein [Rhizobium sp. RU36D]